MIYDLRFGVRMDVDWVWDVSRWNADDAGKRDMRGLLGGNRDGVFGNKLLGMVNYSLTIVH